MKLLAIGDATRMHTYLPDLPIVSQVDLGAIGTQLAKRLSTWGCSTRHILAALPLACSSVHTTWCGAMSRAW